MSGGMQLPEGGRPGRHLAGMLVFQQVERQEVGRQGRRKRVLTQGQGHRKRMLLPHRSGHLQHPAPPKREGEEGPGFHSALQHARGVPDGGDEHQVPLSVFRGVARPGWSCWDGQKDHDPPLGLLLVQKAGPARAMAVGL